MVILINIISFILLKLPIRIWESVNKKVLLSINKTEQIKQIKLKEDATESMSKYIDKKGGHFYIEKFIETDPIKIHNMVAPLRAWEISKKPHAEWKIDELM